MESGRLGLSVSIVKREAAYRMPSTHLHEFHELLYLSSGECNFFLNHKIYKIKAGDLVVVPRGYIHKTNYTGKGESLRFVIKFTHEELRWVEETAGKEAISEMFEKMLFKIPEKRRDYVENLMNSMNAENRQNDEFSWAFNRLHFQELLLFVMRCMRYGENAVRELVVENQIIQDIAAYIYQNYDKNIYLEKVAGEFNISRSYLSKKFKSVTGFGFKEYLTSVRIQEACRRLLETDYSITRIAMECGFNDSNYFGDAFRRYKGISPNKYRKSKGMM